MPREYGDSLNCYTVKLSAQLTTATYDTVKSWQETLGFRSSLSQVSTKQTAKYHITMQMGPDKTIEEFQKEESKHLSLAQ